MIWFGGTLVEEGSLRVSVLDRIFEHGLGLFETFRTWNGHATLLDRHLDRLERSAHYLGIAVRSDMLPGPGDVERLRTAIGASLDAIFRVTVTGGAPGGIDPVLWMRATPLPDAPLVNARVRSSWTVVDDDELASHKTLNYWRKRRIHETAMRDGFDEDLGVSPAGHLREGTRTNVFLIRGGSVHTPVAPGACLPGVMRGVVLDFCDRLGLSRGPCESIPAESLMDADEAFLTNSVRGIVPVSEFRWTTSGRPGHSRIYECPGVLTSRLWQAILPWLSAGGRT